MSETTIETAIETTKELSGIPVPHAAAAVVISLAAYGGYELTGKAARKVAQIRKNRQVKKAEKKAVNANNTPSS